jgi:predicted restriction endonuclease
MERGATMPGPPFADASSDNDLERLKAEILSMRRHRNDGRPVPHKLVLLLAVIDCFADGTFRDNRIYLDDRLEMSFRRHFERFGIEEHRARIVYPFFHLRSSPFWYHRIREGQEASYTASTTVVSKAAANRMIEYAYLSDYAYSVMTSVSKRERLRSWIEELLRDELGD